MRKTDYDALRKRGAFVTPADKFYLKSGNTVSEGDIISVRLEPGEEMLVLQVIQTQPMYARNTQGQRLKRVVAADSSGIGHVIAVSEDELLLILAVDR